MYEYIANATGTLITIWQAGFYMIPAYGWRDYLIARLELVGKK